MIKAPKIKPGDEVRVIAPSMSAALIDKQTKIFAERTLVGMGLRVTYGENSHEETDLCSSSISSRVKDLHDAFVDKSVTLILCALGGFSSHEILDYIDYSLIKANPKRLCGFSDATALSNALYAKTGLVTYSGPCFVNFAMQKGREYMDDYFKQMMFGGQKLTIAPSIQWSGDKWHKDQENRNFEDNDGYWILGQGEARGIVLGGNISTFRLLHGTPFISDTSRDIILFLEDDECEGDENSDIVELTRKLQSIIHQPFFSRVKGIVFGRFKAKSKINRSILEKILKSKKELSNIPVIANADFGHTTPFFTFPIGGEACLKAKQGNVTLEVSE